MNATKTASKVLTEKQILAFAKTYGTIGESWGYYGNDPRLDVQIEGKEYFTRTKHRIYKGQLQSLVKEGKLIANYPNGYGCRLPGTAL
jgi:hypothetical protein